MLDGYVAAIAAGPVSISPPDWSCPLLAIDADPFNHAGKPEFAAISAVALRHNDLGNVLSTAPHRFAPTMPASRMATLMRGRGARDSMPPCG
ncbi:YecA/YgfB family protein [Bradyrhizobium sp. USDA 4454]